jgi:hypothetical protein
MIYYVPYHDESGRLKRCAVDVSKERDPRILTPWHMETLAPRDYRLRSDCLIWDGERVLILRRRFRWNGSSVPLLLRWYCAVDEHLAASAPHDWGYSKHRFEVWDNALGKFAWYRATKSYTDRLFYRLARSAYNERPTKAAAMWLAVHTGGVIAWNFNTCDYRCKNQLPCPQNANGECPTNGDEFSSRISGILT